MSFYGYGWRVSLCHVNLKIVTLTQVAATAQGINHLSALDEHNDFDPDGRVQRYLNCGLSSLELSQMLLVRNNMSSASVSGMGSP